jgi:hypothetical protein
MPLLKPLRQNEPRYTAYIIENRERIKVLHAPVGSSMFVWKQRSSNTNLKGKGKGTGGNSSANPGNEVYIIDTKKYLYRTGLDTIFLYEHGNETPITLNTAEIPEGIPSPEDLYDMVEDKLIKNTVQGIEKMGAPEVMGRIFVVLFIAIMAVIILYVMI